MLKRGIQIIVVLGVLFLGVCAAVCFYIQRPYFVEPKEIEIAEGMTLRQIAHRLQEESVIPNATVFIFYAYAHQSANSLKAGEYRFEGVTRLSVVLDRLVLGEVLLHAIRVIEGWTYREIAQSVTALPFVAGPNFAENFIQLCEDRSILNSFQISAPTCEGSLFPNTYHVRKGITARDFLFLLIRQFQTVYAEQIASRAELSGRTQKDIVTLASLIEKETGVAEERVLVSSVLRNRLKKNMLLQIDPTIIYGLKNFNGNIRKTDISNPHPYNTYVHAGLPPGAICNPGLASLLAAVMPAETTYLYFVSKNDGTHFFSSTLEEHQAAVWKYQKSSK